MQGLFAHDLLILDHDLNRAQVELSFYLDEVILFGDEGLIFIPPNQFSEFDIDLAQIDMSLPVKNVNDAIIVAQIIDQILLKDSRVSVLGRIDCECIYGVDFFDVVVVLMGS